MPMLYHIVESETLTTDEEILDISTYQTVCIIKFGFLRIYVYMHISHNRDS